MLNENLNKTTRKQYKELEKKQKNESELECAIRYWKYHIERNDSIVTDLFSGLLKNELICNNCQYRSISFDSSNTLTLPIPGDRYKEILYDKRMTHKDIKFFYIPKYSIRASCKIEINILKDSPLKNYAEEMNKIETFNYKFNKLVFIRVTNSKLEEFIDQNNYKHKEREFIFAFDDLTKEGEKTKIIPLYIYKNKYISAFPRLLFLKENMDFGELKKLIYYYARNYFNSPFKDKLTENENDEIKEIYNVDKELEKYKEKDQDKNEEKKEEIEKKKKESFDENKLWDLFDKEYDEIFDDDTENEKNEEILEEFFNDFPYKITLKKEFEDNEHFCLFDGKNNYHYLKKFHITNDKDPITSLIQNDKYCLNLVLNTYSKYSFKKFNLNYWESHKGKNVGKKIFYKLTLYDLLEYFNSNELLEEGNEWKCSNCKEKVKVTKKLSLYYLPKLLIICLNRIIRSGINYSKNVELIDFPLENLDMEKYICENSPDRKYLKYDLFAVIQHYGGVEGGHYTAICKNINGNWYNYNDSSVSLSSPDNVVSSAAYVLFYRRRNW